jgi:CheY-like chemotaxis protein
MGFGTGLGLSMVYGFARQSGGQARVYSETGKGATVCLYLPRNLAPLDAADALPAVTAAHVPDQSATVLVVDDEPAIRMLVAEVLEDMGCTVIEVGDAAAALVILRSDTPVELLVTDVGLPGGMNGRQLADAAREKRAQLKVLFITGYAENAMLSHQHMVSGMQVLTKPFAMAVLAGRVRELIAG